MSLDIHTMSDRVYSDLDFWLRFIYPAINRISCALHMWLWTPSLLHARRKETRRYE